MKKLFFQSLLTLVLANVSMAVNIKDFEIENNARLSDKTIKYYLSEFKNEEYSPELENKIIKKLYSLGLFAQIITEPKREILKVIVEENPIIESVEIVGNKKIKSKSIQAELLSQPGSSLTLKNLERDNKLIKHMYGGGGRFYIDGSSSIKKEIPGKVKLEFNIKEGPKIFVRSIFINGLENTDISIRVLKTLITSKRDSLWSNFAGGSSYKPQNLENDISIIKSYLASKGYADVEVLSSIVQLSENGKYFNLIFDVNPGNKYTFNKITVSNPTGVDIKIDKNWLKKNSPFNMNKVDAVSNHISKSLSRIGYPEIVIQPDISKNYNDKTVDVKLLLENTNKYYIDNIIVRNNQKTQTSIILKKMKIAEGDCFNQTKIASSIRRLNESGFFKSVRPEFISKPNGKLDLIVEVDEKPTTKLGFEMTFSSGKMPSMTGSYTELNLIGLGKTLSVNANISFEGSVETGLSFSSPVTFEKDINTFASVNLSATPSTDESELKKLLGIRAQNYRKTAFKLAFGASYSWSDSMSQILQYTFKHESLDLSEEQKKDAKKKGDIISERELGQYTTSALQSKFIFDLSPERPFNDRNMTLTLSAELAGIGGNVKYFKSEAEYKFINQISDDAFIKFKLSGGVMKAIGDYSLRTDEKFISGEPIVKGFESRGIGPRLDKSKIDPVKFKDSKPIDGKSLNGEWYYAASLQYEKTIFIDEILRLKGLAFIDIGSTFGVDKYYEGKYIETKTPRVSVGIGAAVEFAAFLPPVTVNFSYPLMFAKEDKLQYFNFAVNFEF